MSQSTWSVKNQTSGETLEGLSPSEFVRWASALPFDEVEKWLASPSASGQWASLSAISGFRLRRFGLPVIPAELGFSQPQLSWLEKNLSQQKGLEVRQQALPAAVAAPPPPSFFRERRAHERFDVRLQVVVVSEENAFRTFTRNISLGGLALEKPVPKKLTGSTCTIFISDPSSHRKISFSGAVIADPGKSESQRFRIRFEKMDAKASQDLEVYIRMALGDEAEAA